MRLVANGMLVGVVSWMVTSMFLTTETARPFWVIFGISLALPRLLASEEARAAAAGYDDGS
jgi:hypothetical protein